MDCFRCLNDNNGIVREELLATLVVFGSFRGVFGFLLLGVLQVVHNISQARSSRSILDEIDLLHIAVLPLILL